MRSFLEIKLQLQLIKFVDSTNGTLYCVPVAPNTPRLVVRHFDRALPATFVLIYVNLLTAAQKWISCDPELFKMVRVEQPTEIGTDFIARRHYLGNSLSSFYDDEDPPLPPKEMCLMQSRFHELVNIVNHPADIMISQILARSLLEPTAKTIFDESERKFVVVDLKPTLADLYNWSHLITTSSPDFTKMIIIQFCQRL